MKTAVVFVLGLLVGSAVTWWLPPKHYPHLYQTTQPLKLIDGTTGQETGVLPSNTLLLAQVKLTRTPDLGWYGCAPVVFNDMWMAQDLGVVPWDGKADIWERITLSALPLNDKQPPETN